MEYTYILHIEIPTHKFIFQCSTLDKPMRVNIKTFASLLDA